ncbi:MAG TPA: META domain-containing protein [Burkholderiales bacterium]
MKAGKRRRAGFGTALAAWGLAAMLAACAASSPQEAARNLTGTAWQLVRFEGGDGTVRVPDVRSKYTLSFAPDATVHVRFDCNRGRGSWRSEGPSQLAFGPLALTRAMCPPGSLHDLLVKQWPHVRTYVLRDGRLYLSLMADGGIFELEPLAR